MLSIRLKLVNFIAIDRMRYLIRILTLHAPL
jgi:hypothetical protein